MTNVSPSILTEDQIEERIEKMTDAADDAYLGGSIDVEQYDIEMKRIDDWGRSQYTWITNSQNA